MALKLFNTLGRELQEFKPLKANKTVGLYSCGPTVYNYAHIGNLRSYVLSDILRRTLEYNDYRVSQIINITDVGHLTSDADEGEDKIEKGAREQGKTAAEIANFYTEAFFVDLHKLNIKTDGTVFPKATEHITEQIDLIKKLEEKDFTYKTSDGIYFDTSKYPTYPELAKLDLAGLKEGARIEANQEKKNITDFALWKFSKPTESRQQEWNSPWGAGFPGWHIECSAMSIKYLGETFDIHTGGIDHVPVHHTNERAQAECATGKTFVNYWLHNEFINIAGERIAKSIGNTIKLSEIESSEISPLAYRYLLLTAHYRSQLNFTWESLGAAQTALVKLYKIAADLKTKTGHAISEPGAKNEYAEQFLNLINNDLDTPKALALVWEMFKSPLLTNQDKLELLLKFDEIFGLKINENINSQTAKAIVFTELPAEIKNLVLRREKARLDKDWAESDRLRDEIASAGYDLKDTPEGPTITKN